jgi:hypothetical protein
MENNMKAILALAAIADIALIINIYHHWDDNKYVARDSDKIKYQCIQDKLVRV